MLETIAAEVKRMSDVDPELDRMPEYPEHTGELRVAVYLDDDSTGVPELLRASPLQVQLIGTPRALEALGAWMVELARMQSGDPDQHEHFEDVQNEHGGRMHLIIRRREERRT